MSEVRAMKTECAHEGLKQINIQRDLLLQKDIRDGQPAARAEVVVGSSQNAQEIFINMFEDEIGETEDLDPTRPPRYVINVMVHVKFDVQVMHTP